MAQRLCRCGCEKPVRQREKDIGSYYLFASNACRLKAQRRKDGIRNFYIHSVSKASYRATHNPDMLLKARRGDKEAQALLYEAGVRALLSEDKKTMVIMER